MTLVDALQERLIDRSEAMDEEPFILHGLWEMDLAFCPHVGERTFQYHVKIAQTVRQGACYCFDDGRTLDADLIGEDARYIRANDECFRIAILDAAFAALKDDAAREFYLEGTASEKAAQRADIVVKEVLAQIEGRSDRPSLVNVGVIGTILEKLRRYDVDLYATDLEPALVGQRLSGVRVQDGERYTLEHVARCDVALVTGMTLANNSLEEILRVARRNQTKVVLFNETGAWFAQELCDNFGVDAVIAEPFPFYIFEGQSLIRVHRPKG